MKKIVILFAFILAMFAFGVYAGIGTTMEEAFQKGNLVQGTLVGNFTTSTSTAYVLVKFPTRDLNMLLTTASSGIRVTAIGTLGTNALAVTNSGTALKLFNPNTTKTNWFGVRAYSGPSGWSLGSTNMTYWAPSGVIDAPSRIYFKNSVTNNYLFKLQNTHTTNAKYGVTFKFWY